MKTDNKECANCEKDNCCFLALCCIPYDYKHFKNKNNGV